MRLDLFLKRNSDFQTMIRQDVIEFLTSSSITKRYSCSERLKGIFVDTVMSTLDQKDLVKLASEVTISFPDNSSMNSLHEENKKLTQVEFLTYIVEKKPNLVDVSLIIQ